MSEFVIQKKTKCGKCNEYGVRSPDDDYPFLTKCSCVSGYIYEEVPLTRELLAEIIGVTQFPSESLVLSDGDRLSILPDGYGTEKWLEDEREGFWARATKADRPQGEACKKHRTAK